MKTMVFFNYMETIGRMLIQSPPATKSTATHMLILSGQVLTDMLSMWIKGYETGIRMFININKH